MFKKVLFLVVFVCILVFSLFKNSQIHKDANNIAYCENQSLELQKCPKNLGKIFLPRSYQARSIFIAYSNDLHHKNFLDLILKKVKKLNPVPVVNVLISRTEVPEARTYFQDKYLLENRKFLNYIPTPSDDTIWQQDYYELLFDTKSGRVSIVDLPYKSREGEDLPSAISLYCKKPLIEQPINYSIEEPPDTGDFGGNIEPFSEKLLVVGNNMTKITSSWLKKLTSQKVIEVDVSWLLTGHVDELFSILPHTANARPCDQTLLYASPAKAMDLLKDYQGRQVPMLLYEKNIFEDEMTWPAFEECIVNKKRPAKICSDLFRANKTYEKIQQDNIKLIQDQMQFLHNCKLTTLPIPQLFAPHKTQQDLYGTPEDYAVAFNNNSVNNIFFWPYLFLPKQRVGVFQTYIENVLKKFPIELNFIAGEFVHSLAGGIHCATNISYACRP